MAQQPPLMPKATAVWLVDHTALSFEQIADFCHLHKLEVKGIADGDVARGIMGQDPTKNGQLTEEEIKRCEADEEASLELAVSDMPVKSTVLPVVWKVRRIALSKPSPMLISSTMRERT